MSLTLHIFKDIFKDIGQLLFKDSSPHTLINIRNFLSKEITHYKRKNLANFNYFISTTDTRNYKTINSQNVLIIEIPNGLQNYNNHIYNFTISALLQKDGKLVEMLHYHPILDTFLLARRGEGLFFNEKRINKKFNLKDGLSVQLEFSEDIEETFRDKCANRLLSNFGSYLFRNLRSSGSWGAGLFEISLLNGNPCFFGFGLSKFVNNAINLFFSELTGTKVFQQYVEIRRGFYVSVIGVDHERGHLITKGLKGALRPHPFPLPSVDALITFEDGIVLIWRRNPPFGWALPGGFVEYGESLEEAVIREVKEETGLDFHIEGLLGCYSNPKSDPRFHSISYVFFGKGIGSLRAGDDASRAKVFKLNEIPWGQFAFEHEEIVKDYLRLKRT